MKLIKPFDLFLEYLISDKNGLFKNEYFEYNYNYNYKKNVLNLKIIRLSDNAIEHSTLFELIEDDAYNNVKTILEHVNLDINRKYNEFNKWYYYILNSVSKKMIKLLLTYGADINVVNDNNESLFSYFWINDENLFFLLDNNIKWDLPVIEYTFVDHIFLDNEVIFDFDKQYKLRKKLKERYPDKYDYYYKKYKAKKINI